MMRSTAIATAAAMTAISFGFVTGCSSSDQDVAPGARGVQHYEYKAGGQTLVVVPAASDLVDLAKPTTTTGSGAVTIVGTVRLRQGPINPAANMRIGIVDRHGNVTDEIHASLKEDGAPGTFSYRVHFVPIPPTGSTITIAYEDWHPTADYSSQYIGTGGNNAGRSSDNAAVQTGQGGGSTQNRSYGTNNGGGLNSVGHFGGSGIHMSR